MDSSASLQEPTSASRIGTLLLEAATTMLEPASTNSTCSLQGPASDSTIRTRLQEVATTGDNTIVLEPAYTDSTASLQEPTSASRTGTETATTGDTTIVLQPACTYSPGSLQVPTSESRMGPPLLEADTTGDATIVPDLACTDSTDLLEGSTSASTMGTRLLEAATIGDTTIVLQPASHDPVVLLATTPQGNTCLHIASIQGDEEFCMKILTLDQSRVLLSAINEDGETALLTAVSRGRATLASLLLRRCRDQQLIEAILKQDKRGCNALHHSICNGHVKLALELIEAEPDLSRAVNKQNESPMFAAVMRNQTDVFEKLLEIPSSAHGGVFGNNALHAAARNGNSAIAKRIMEERPWLVRQENEYKRSPMHLAANENKIHVITALLKYDRTLGYLISKDGAPLLCIAASKGHVDIARELLRHCPDAPYSYANNGSTCLHAAVLDAQTEFVRFVLRSEQLHHLIKVADNRGDTALGLASRINQPELTAALQSHLDIELSRGPRILDECLLEAAVSGHAAEMNRLALQDLGVLLGTTGQGNTCLHISSIHGHEKFCKDVQVLNPSLLAAVNSDGETPLLIAVASGHVSVASDLLRYCHERNLSETILKQDKRGCNALHHAISSGYTKLALDLLEAEPALSHAVTRYGESPMFIAVMRDHEDVLNKLLEIPGSAHGGAYGHNALHAAMRTGNLDIVKKIMEKRPWQVKEEDKEMKTPMHLAVLWDKIHIIKELLQRDRSLGYVVNIMGDPLLIYAAYRGQIDVAREVLRYCPDAPFCKTNGWTCLHEAVSSGQTKFVEFVLGSPQLQRIVNMRDSNGETALHVAVGKCKPKMVAALLLHKDIDVTVRNNKGQPPLWRAGPAADAKTLNWNEVFMLMVKADPKYASSISSLYKEVQDKVTDFSRDDIKSLTQKYTGSNSIVAALIASITFTAAFTVSKEYSTTLDARISRKIAFYAFMISDVFAMCTSLLIAFIHIIAKWEDLEFLLYYRSLTRKLMWFAYAATTTAFGTGLYTVLAPRLLWLAVAVWVVTPLFPILAKLLAEFPIMLLRFRLGKAFKSDLLNMV